MQVKIDKSFEKDVKKINNKKVLQKISEAIKNTQNAAELKDINNLKKLTGTKNEYRIRIGDYRIGIIITNETAEFIRCLHRKDIYKYFPK